MFGPERAGDIKHSNADIEKARELLGYEYLACILNPYKSTNIGFLIFSSNRIADNLFLLFHLANPNLGF